MIDISSLWTKLRPKENNIEGIKQDLKAGLVPNLPYFIIDNKDAKAKITEDLLNIDTQFSLAYIIGNYGNGKTNLLRYLEYFSMMCIMIEILLLLTGVQMSISMI